MIKLHKNRWLQDNVADLFVCHEEGSGASDSDAAATAAAYAAAVADAMAGRGEMGYPGHEGGVFGGPGLGASGDAGYGGAEFAGFDPYSAYAALTTSDLVNMAGLHSGRGYGDVYGTPGENDQTDVTGYPAGRGALGPIGPDVNPDSIAGRGAARGAGQGNQGDTPADVSNPSFSPTSTFAGFDAPGQISDLGGLGGWEGFDPRAAGQVRSMNPLDTWYGEQGGFNPLVQFIRGGFSGHRLYTPEHIADTYTDIGISPTEAYEQLAGRGHVASPIYSGLHDLNTGGGDPGQRPIFPGAFPGGAPYPTQGEFEHYMQRSRNATPEGVIDVQQGEPGYNELQDLMNYRQRHGITGDSVGGPQQQMGALAAGPWSVQDLNRYAGA